MNRTFIKAGATAAVLAGLMGGVAAAPSVVYADAPAAEQQSVTKEQLEAELQKVLDAQPMVTPLSWIRSGADYAVTAASNTLSNKGAVNFDIDYKRLATAYAKLQPGQNLTARFSDPVTNMLKGDSEDANGTSLVRAHWVNSDAKGEVVRRGNSLSIALDGMANWNKGGVACVGENRADKSAQPAYIQFDLGQSEGIKSFKLWRGSVDGSITSENTALTVSDDVNFAKDKTTVVYYSWDGKDNADVFNLGEAPKDSYYAETAEGKDLFEGKQPVHGRYVRLYLNGATASNYPNIHKGGETRILELAIEGTGKVETSKLYDTAALEAAVKDANTILAEHASEYTAASLEVLKNQVAEGQALLDSIKAGTATDALSAPDAMAGKVNDAVEALVAAVHVTFDDKIEATDNATVEVVKGEKVAKPADPKHPAGYTFAGWFLEKDGKTPFDFNAAVDKDVTVYAKWTLDAPLVQDNATRPSVPMTEIEDIAKKPTQPAMKLEPAKKKEPSKKDALPQTGDPSMLIAGASAAASAVAFAAARRRK